jgi:hypothetical protein
MSYHKSRHWSRDTCPTCLKVIGPGTLIQSADERTYHYDCWRNLPAQRAARDERLARLLGGTR